MNEEDALLAAVRAAPQDHTPRLVLADWYDDHDMPHEAAYHRAVVTSRQAEAATAAVGSHIRTVHPPTTDAGTTLRIGHAHPEQWSRSARFAMSDTWVTPADPNRPTVVSGQPHVSAEYHMRAAYAHRDAATSAETHANEPEVAAMHRAAADSHEAASRALFGLGGIDTFAEYKERTPSRYGTRRPAEANNFEILTDPRTGKATPRISVYYQNPGPPGTITHSPAPRKMHPADFHRLHVELPE